MEGSAPLRRSAGRAACAARGATGDTWGVYRRRTQRTGVGVRTGVGGTRVGVGAAARLGVGVAAGRAVEEPGSRSVGSGVGWVGAGVAFSTLRGLVVGVGAAGAGAGARGGGAAGTTRGAAGFSAITGALNG